MFVSWTLPKCKITHNFAYLECFLTLFIIIVFSIYNNGVFLLAYNLNLAGIQD